MRWTRFSKPSRVSTGPHMPQNLLDDGSDGSDGSAFASRTFFLNSNSESGPCLTKDKKSDASETLEKARRGRLRARAKVVRDLLYVAGG
ncbi:hypothetical protein ACLOJK_035638 [Asimina triloba]